MFKKSLLALSLSFLAFTPSAFATDSTKEKIGLSPNAAKSIVETISILSGVYVDPIPQKEFEEKIISGILSKFDSHSNYLSSEDLKEFSEEMNGQYAGLGMIAKRPENGTKGVKIEELLKKGPADMAGLAEGDIIIKAGDKELTGALQDSIKLLKGKAGTQVKVTYLRGTEVKETVVTRNNIPTNSVFSNFCECNGANSLFLRIVGFNEKTGDEAIEALMKNMPKNPTAIVLDLKDNPGGMLQSSLEISSLFLNKDSLVVSTKERVGGDSILKVNEESTRPDFWKKRQQLIETFPNLTGNIPLYVMINSSSASASEIVAAALKDHKRATLVGEKTFGKGSVQKMIPLTNGGAIKITIARYYTPSGETIQAKGVIPHIEIVDDRPWKITLMDLLKKKHLEKTPKSFERESDIPNHLAATYKTNEQLLKQFEEEISENTIFIKKNEPYEKRFSYHPLSSEGKMDSITSATIQSINKKNKEVLNQTKRKEIKS